MEEKQPFLLKKILIVEDDVMLCYTFEMFLQNIGHQTLACVHDAQTALQQCKESLPDIVLMDIHLTGDINGIETAKILQDEYDLPIIFLSSDVNPDTIKNAILKNSYGFLVKPIVKKAALATAIEFAYCKHRFLRGLPLD